MSIDRLQVGLQRTAVNPPDTYENSALTSPVQQVSLGLGLTVNNCGKLNLRPTPQSDTFGPQRVDYGTITPDGTIHAIDSTSAVGNLTLSKTGAKSGDLVCLINAGSYTMTFGPSNSSFVANGTTESIGTKQARWFVYEGKTALWYGAH